MSRVLLALLLVFVAQAQNKTMVPEYMDACIKQAVAGRSPEQLDEQSARQLRQELLGALGLDPRPAKTPLNARITGRLERDGYVIDKVVYETFPQFYATAYLYLPTEGDQPVPAVVCPVGHWSRKKLEPVVQARCIGLALHGFAVLCIDMPGFGGPNNDERNFPGSHSDWRLHMSSLSPVGVMVWDVVRGIDYLESRPEVDATRIGVTGASGGGMTTMYAAAVDERIRCYAPVCYATSYEDNYNNGCLCNHVPGAMVIGDRSDVMALVAPKPVLLIGAEHDPEFPKPGTLRCHAKLLKHYEAAGAPDACQAVIAPGGHDYCKPMREPMYGFMRKHLMGVGDGGPAAELRELPATRRDPAVNVEDPRSKEVLCFPDGRAPADAKSLLQLARERARKLATQAEERTAKVNPAALREELRTRLLRLYPVPERAPLDVHVVAAEAVSQERISGSYVSEPGLRIPFTLTRPALAPLRRSVPSSLPVRIVFSELGLGDASATPIERGGGPYIEMRIDGRGLGSLPGLEMRLATYLGRPDVWMWAWDVSRGVDYLVTLPDVDSANIEVWGFGPAGGQVAYLAALLDPRIKRAYGQRTLRSYLDVFERGGLPRFALPHRILEVGDLPLMRKAVAAGENR